MTTLRLYPAPLNAFDRQSGGPTTCQCCGREDLRKTVKMTDGSAILWLGRGCAAKSMGIGLREYEKAAKGVQKVADDAEAAERQAAWKAEDARWQAFLDSRAPGLDRFRQIEALGGYAKANAAYKADG